MDPYFSTYEELLDSSLAFSGENHQYFDQYKIYCIDRYLGKKESTKSILDYGCGTGRLTELIAQSYSGSTVFGYDISTEALSIAETKDISIKNVKYLNHLDDGIKFDLIVVINVFHHITRDDQKDELSKLRNKLNPDGRIVIIEHNPVNPITQYIVKGCPFDKDAELIPYRRLKKLALSCDLKVSLKKYFIFFPPVLKILRPVEHYLGAIPLGAQYMAVFSANDCR